MVRIGLAGEQGKGKAGVLSNRRCFYDSSSKGNKKLPSGQLWGEAGRKLRHRTHQLHGRPLRMHELTECCQWPPKVSAFIIPVLWRRKLKHRDIKELAQDHTAGQWLSQVKPKPCHWSPGPLRCIRLQSGLPGSSMGQAPEPGTGSHGSNIRTPLAAQG